ncbi:MAG: 3-methyl-2-oxobutanoate hydroxymethyltransferase [Candidatus Cloacimonetes bacterium]|nr:3-methyl-2-oxobutanoate hydroxymethyltransferase [Candidatus Cloacimonadota bacterium]
MHTVSTFNEMKKKGERIVMVTAYDYPSARFAAAAGVDLILVGDSLGMVVLGYDTTLAVTMDDIVHHGAAVRRGAPEAFIVADMPWMSYHVSEAETRRNASRLIVDGGANAVKLEGGSPGRLDAIRAIVDCEIPVVAHLGLTPQSVHRFGGYKVQGRDDEGFQRILQQARQIEDAGASMVVLEAIPEELGKQITQSLRIPTIGIGAGRHTDGQVLVYHDLLGLSGMDPKFLKRYATLDETIITHLKQYANDVRTGEFPQRRHVYVPTD